MMELVKNLLRILAYWFNSEERRRRQKAKILDEIYALETEYAKALEEGDPERATKAMEKMGKLRDRLRYVEGGDE